MTRTSRSPFAVQGVLTKPPVRRAALALALVLAGCRFCHRCLGFASIAAPAVMQQQRHPEGSTAVEERPRRRKSEEEEFKDRLKDMNMTLEASSGKPDDIIPGVTNAVPYVTCFVEIMDRTQRDDFGSVTPKQVLEEWIMRGDDHTVNSFAFWRQRDAVMQSLRCVQTSSQAAEETMCLQCVSPTTSVAMLQGVPNVVGTVHPNSVMTFGGLRNCLSSAVRRPGFCKAGTVSMSV